MSELQRVSVFHSGPDTILTCIRDRIAAEHKLVVDSLADLVDRVKDVPASGLGLDLIGHSQNGFLRLGPEIIDDTQPCVDVFRALATRGVTEVRLLGCEVADHQPTAKASFRRLRQQVPELAMRASVRIMGCRDYDHHGLRIKEIPSVFGGVPSQHTVDTPFPVRQFLSENPTAESRTAITIESGMLQQLERLLPVSYSTCCPRALRMRPPLVTFQVRGDKGFGLGRIAETDHNEVIVVLSSADLEVAYHVETANIPAVRALIATWGGSSRSEIQS